VIPPVLVNPAAMEGTGFLGQAAENVYRIEKDDVYLVGTSEVPLAAMHMDEILPVEKLPLRYAGYSSCFRREAGTYGKDTRGIIRVHQFDKVEMFSFCKPEDAKAEHKKLLQWEKDFLTAMEIPFRIANLISKRGFQLKVRIEKLPVRRIALISRRVVLIFVTKMQMELRPLQLLMELW
jgi:seryl-tRNA synthetase